MKNILLIFMREYMSIEVRNNTHFVLYRYCCKGRYSVNIHLKCLEVREFDHDWSHHPVIHRVSKK